MRTHRELQITYKGRMMIGQAGVYRVMSELLLRGHVPSVPCVDTGVDIALDNGLRMQVKSVTMRPHPGYPEGAYCFSVKENNHGSKKRDWTKVVDFLVYWGINENRFFVIPAADATQNFWIRPKNAAPVIDSYRVRNLRNNPKGNRHLVTFEDRWDLLNINQALTSVEAASAEVSEV